MGTPVVVMGSSSCSRDHLELDDGPERSRRADTAPGPVHPQQQTGLSHTVAARRCTPWRSKAKNFLVGGDCLLGSVVV